MSLLDISKKLYQISSKNVLEIILGFKIGALLVGLIISIESFSKFEKENA